MKTITKKSISKAVFITTIVAASCTSSAYASTGNWQFMDEAPTNVELQSINHDKIIKITHRIKSAWGELKRAGARRSDVFVCIGVPQDRYQLCDFFDDNKFGKD